VRTLCWLDPVTCAANGIRPLLLTALCLANLAATAAPTPGTATAAATTGATGFALPRWTVDGGGGRSTGGTYAIHGTIGQPDADPLQPSAGGAFAITGGFWPGAPQVDVPETVFADGFE
jgi:hypothetical protein